MQPFISGLNTIRLLFVHLLALFFAWLWCKERNSVLAFMGTKHLMQSTSLVWTLPRLDKMIGQSDPPAAAWKNKEICAWNISHQTTNVCEGICPFAMGFVTGWRFVWPLSTLCLMETFLSGHCWMFSVNYWIKNYISSIPWGMSVLWIKLSVFLFVAQINGSSSKWITSFSVLLSPCYSWANSMDISVCCIYTEYGVCPAMAWTPVHGQRGGDNGWMDD